MHTYSTFTSQQLSSGNDFVNVYNHEFTRVYEVPQRCVPHLPPPELQITRLVRCTHYKPFDRDSCRCGERCKFVHADCDYELLNSHSVHVNYIWPSGERCIYPRLPSGGHLLVYAPNQRLPCEVIPSEMVLVTLGSINYRSGAPLSHCAHYYLRRQCDLGNECRFIHAVYVDRTVKQLYKRAPPRFGQVTVASSAQPSLPVNILNVTDDYHNNHYKKNYNYASELSESYNLFGEMTGHTVMMQHNNDIFTSSTLNVFTESNQINNTVDIPSFVFRREGNVMMPFNTSSEPTTTSELSWPEPPFISETTLEIVNRASELSLQHDDNNSVGVESSTNLPKAVDNDVNAELRKDAYETYEDPSMMQSNVYLHNPYDLHTGII